jgi:hypothetical protein
MEDQVATVIEKFEAKFVTPAQAEMPEVAYDGGPRWY